MDFYKSRSWLVDLLWFFVHQIETCETMILFSQLLEDCTWTLIIRLGNKGKEGYDLTSQVLH
jgi:hypothetical protein